MKILDLPITDPELVGTLSLSEDGADGHWITVNGAHILIRGGSSEHEQVARFLEGKAKETGKPEDRAAAAAHRASATAYDQAGAKPTESPQEAHGAAGPSGSPSHSEARSGEAGGHSGAHAGAGGGGMRVGGGGGRVGGGSKKKKGRAGAIMNPKKHLGLSLEAAEEGEFMLFPGLVGSPFLALGERETTADGKPIRRFRKEIIRCDRFTKARDGISFEVTPRSLEHWVVEFNRMKENGVKVYFPEGHTNKAGANRGYWTNLEVAPSAANPNTPALWGQVEVIGEDGLALIGRSDVSLYSPPELTDGRGNKYHRPIVHIAACTDPVIPGLGDWEAVAAALTPFHEAEDGEDEEDLDAEEGEEDEDAAGETEAEEKAEGHGDRQDARSKDYDYEDAHGRGGSGSHQLSHGDNTMNVATICRKLGIDLEQVNADNAEELILSGIEKMEAKQDSLMLSSGGRKADPATVRILHENRTLKLNGLIDAGKLTPACAAEFADIFSEPDALELSLERGDDHFDDIVRILADNDPVTFGHKTRAQVNGKTVKLSTGSKGEDDGDDAEPDEDEDDKDILVKDADKRAAKAEEFKKKAACR